ncbi:hypothetical protein M1D55_10195 [Cupriavidus sp. JZ107]
MNIHGRCSVTLRGRSGLPSRWPCCAGGWSADFTWTIRTAGRAVFFRQQAPWYYLFSGIDSGISDGAMVVVSAVVPMKDQSYLYTGLLEDFEFKSDGELERIILSAASRRKLTDDRGRGLEEHGRFYPIEGNRLVIRSTEWTTLNVKFLVEEKAEASAPALADD